ncbi:MAG: AraC family transcriptional regulator [Alteromonadaceae bacterium]|nr:MAG: AraC family transcriptional regulator [Alteromonadaceae bacterium]
MMNKFSAQQKLQNPENFEPSNFESLDLNLDIEEASGENAIGHYLKKARLPDVVGVPARVVEVLTQRIGQAPLGITEVAEELNFSKRTLQRRLQKQNVNFAELRDQVRFHFSIDYLVRQQLNVDSISTALDFSDRTSFTNAFKRWTGLSPSNFRKLFRDYV